VENETFYFESHFNSKGRLQDFIRREERRKVSFPTASHFPKVFTAA